MEDNKDITGWWTSIKHRDNLYISSVVESVSGAEAICRTQAGEQLTVPMSKLSDYVKVSIPAKYDGDEDDDVIAMIDRFEKEEVIKTAVKNTAKEPGPQPCSASMCAIRFDGSSAAVRLSKGDAAKLKAAKLLGGDAMLKTACEALAKELACSLFDTIYIKASR